MNIVFHSEPPAQVFLISAPDYPDEALATVTRGYSQVYDEDITKAEIDAFLKDLEATKLKTPTGFINFVWLLKNVTRNFEQQLTRYRVGTSFVAESLRFSNKRSAEFYVPSKLTPDQAAVFENTCAHSLAMYERMLSFGAEVQDARGVLPSNICTHMFVSMNLQTLSHIYTQRRCCQAQQDEWKAVLRGMTDILHDDLPEFLTFLKAPWEEPNTVSCGFGASFDRPCQFQGLFDDNLRKLAKERLT